LSFRNQDIKVHKPRTDSLNTPTSTQTRTDKF